MGVYTMVGTWSERKDLINKVGYENIIGAWNSLFEVHDKEFIAMKTGDIVEKFEYYTTYEILSHINPKGFNVKKDYIYINRKGQISSTTSARRLVKERIINLQYLLDNWDRVADKYRVLYTRKEQA